MQEKEWSIERLEEHIRVAEKKVKEKSRKNEFEFFVPVTYSLRKRNFTFLGNNFNTLSSSQIKKSFKDDKFQHWNNSSMKVNIHQNYPYLCFKNQGENFGSAFNEFYPTFVSLQ